MQIEKEIENLCDMGKFDSFLNVVNLYHVKRCRKNNCGTCNFTCNLKLETPELRSTRTMRCTSVRSTSSLNYMYPKTEAVYNLTNFLALKNLSKNSRKPSKILRTMIILFLILLFVVLCIT